MVRPGPAPVDGDTPAACDKTLDLVGRRRAATAGQCGQQGVDAYHQHAAAVALGATAFRVAAWAVKNNLLFVGSRFGRAQQVLDVAQ